jgi:predicted DCC family thiol-disulfide oxidoreductase YuxK
MIPTDIGRDATRSEARVYPTEDARWIVLYDSDCGFCRWSLARLLALDRDRRLRPLALGTQQADTLLADLTPEQRAASWHLISPDGRRASAGAAAAPLLRALPGGRVPAAALARMPKPTERTYRWVADHRSLLSRIVPDRAKRRADDLIVRRERETEPRR